MTQGDGFDGHGEIVETTVTSDSVHAQSLPGLRGLDFVEENVGQTETILLIHGACASGSDWNLVTPYLSSYHLLIPSLFKTASLDPVRRTRQTFQGTRHVSPNLARWDSCFVFHLAELVNEYARNGRAHIVGLSFGGCLAVKMAARHPDLCMSLFVSGLPMLVSPPLYPLMKPIGTGVMWLSHAVVRMIGTKNVNRFLEGEVDTDPGAWDGKGGGATVEMNGILSETIVHDGKCDYYAERIEQEPLKSEFVAREELRIRFVAASRKSRWTPVSDSPEWAVEVAKIMCGLRKSATNPDKGENVQNVNCKVYEAKRMFHPWTRQDPELFAQCVLATIIGSDFPSQGLDEVWSYLPGLTHRV